MKLVRSKLTAMALAMCAWALAVLVPPTQAQTDDQELRSTLVESTGPSYATARLAALELPAGSFDRLIVELNADGPATVAAAVASALRVRRDTPAIAQEFDEQLKNAIDNPDLNTRSGRPSYKVWWPLDRFELDPLAFEVILKRLAPDLLRAKFVRSMGRKNEKNVGPLLALVDSDGIVHAGWLRFATEGNVAEQDRITPAIVEAHKKWRRRGQESAAGIWLLSQFGRATQLVALKQIVEFEKDLADSMGITPWEDADARKHFEAAVLEVDSASRRLQAARDSQQGAAQVAALSHELKAAEQRMAAARTRAHVRELWIDLDQRVKTLEGTPVNVVPPTRPTRTESVRWREQPLH